MSDLRVPKEAAMIASCAADQFAQLEALFDAVRAYLTECTYECSLVDMGLSVASRYSADMRGIAQAEVGHG
ncbi:Uncharacterised protein [Burkholderia pseudomallei]|uniref:hypothetical protein n=1 Tax=Burkholderia pseudomallei TaxID=28450 RepID=UPI00051020E6|nr:hypothetical protein [Burkholderia pseudomallei]KGD48592.1 hypothetical protein DP43_2409 [Burkholderia pseudomallei]MCW0130289.1 hypothetical protein [Burkholderia pseudomallei]CAJ3000260.1 Uncharacterised protein [Burkholderia pseudomallei]CAJ3764849.1 Uncharacterised protein [Burkholderia pseudomallei]CAJ4339981.1 Uncharacterised protein [Burkholderia pseudomallei]